MTALGVVVGTAGGEMVSLNSPQCTLEGWCFLTPCWRLILWAGEAAEKYLHKIALLPLSFSFLSRWPRPLGYTVAAMPPPTVSIL